MRGSGAQQQQYATVLVVNTGSRTCTLTGYAGFSLRRAGAGLGSPAGAGTASAAIALGPGQRAQALVHGPTTCQAEVSDTVRVSLPGQTAYVDAAVPMRACALSVDGFVRA